MATVANVWVVLFPVTLFIVYCFSTADFESLVSPSYVRDDSEEHDE